jgi:hypothetical protein
MAEQKKRDRRKQGRQREQAAKYKAIGRRRLAEMIRAHKIPAAITPQKGKP